jgi:hypothetical protein
MGILEKYHFREWPFQTHPGEEAAAIWADRKELLRQMNRLLEDAVELSPSTVHPLWGWWGAGKTHTLKYLAIQGRKMEKPCFSVYVELPVECRSFRGFYTAVWNGLASEQRILGDLFLEVHNEVLRGNKHDFISKICPQLPDFYKAMYYLFSPGSQYEDKARIWLSGEKLDSKVKKDLEMIGLSTFIDTDERAIVAVQSLIQMVAASRKWSRFLLLVDEFQRLSRLTSNYRANFQIALDRLFNGCPKHLTMILAYSARSQDRIERLVSGGLHSRMGAKERLSVGLLEKDEAVTFLKELFAAYRDSSSGDEGNPFFPFDEDAIRYIINAMDAKGWHLKPRNLIEVVGRIAKDGRDDIRSRKDSLSEATARKHIEIIAKDEGISAMMMKED